MIYQIAKSIMSPDGNRRVDFVKRDDENFQFTEWRRNTRDVPEDIWSDPETWSPLHSSSNSIFETLEIAEREAKSKISWFEKL